MGFLTNLNKLMDGLYDTAMKYGDPSRSTPEDIARATKARNNHKYCAKCGEYFRIDLDDEYDCMEIYCRKCRNNH